MFVLVMNEFCFNALAVKGESGYELNGVFVSRDGTYPLSGVNCLTAFVTSVIIEERSTFEVLEAVFSFGGAFFFFLEGCSRRRFSLRFILGCWIGWGLAAWASARSVVLVY